MNQLRGEIQAGDVILSNHPVAGGSHLPDLTVITPVFLDDCREPIFFVANRGHHADIGGLTPGSMPPNSTSLDQEGAVFKCFKLVKQGVFQEEELVAALMAPAKLPGCSGSRNLNDNLSDLHAQIAANQKGIDLGKGHSLRLRSTKEEPKIHEHKKKIFFDLDRYLVTKKSSISLFGL
jgi:5-oxoprolinase (ATP-hydrolysing)